MLNLCRDSKSPGDFEAKVLANLQHLRMEARRRGETLPSRQIAAERDDLWSHGGLRAMTAVSQCWAHRHSGGEARLRRKAGETVWRPQIPGPPGDASSNQAYISGGFCTLSGGIRR